VSAAAILAEKKGEEESFWEMVFVGVMEEAREEEAEWGLVGVPTGRGGGNLVGDAADCDDEWGGGGML